MQLQIHGKPPVLEGNIAFKKVHVEKYILKTYLMLKLHEHEVDILRTWRYILAHFCRLLKIALLNTFHQVNFGLNLKVYTREPHHITLSN